MRNTLTYRQRAREAGTEATLAREQALADAERERDAATRAVSDATMAQHRAEPLALWSRRMLAEATTIHARARDAYMAALTRLAVLTPDFERLRAEFASILAAYTEAEAERDHSGGFLRIATHRLEATTRRRDSDVAALESADAALADALPRSQEAQDAYRKAQEAL